MIFFLVLCMTAGTRFNCAFAFDDNLDEAIATDLINRDEAEIEAQYKARISSPRLEAEADNFAAALAQDYRPVAGTITLTEESRFYIISQDEPVQELRDTVEFMAGEFAAHGIPSSGPLEIVYGEEESALDGDIVIMIKSPGSFIPILDKHLDNASAKEAYELDAGDRVELSACSFDGIYYGLMTLMEIAVGKKSDGDGVTLDRFRITDAPDLRERAIFLDCARKYFSKDWIEDFIRRSSLQRYNTIILHFSEAECLRLDSEVFPWLTDGVDSLSREEMTEIVEFAGDYHMKVIPSIDTPGHNRYMVSKYAAYVADHPDFTFEYGGKTYNIATKGFSSIANHYSRDGVTLKVTDIGIDITKEHAVAFSNALIDDYAKFFRSLGCVDFDICGDEIMGWSNFMLGDNEVSYENRWLFLEHWRKYARKTLGITKGSASDTFITYLNSVAERLEAAGYTCRVFNDEIDINDNQHIRLKESIGITCWDLSNNSAAHFADNGHIVYNGVMQWSYYVVRKSKGKDIMKGRYKTVNPRNIYENWDPRSFSSKKGKNLQVDDEKFGGACFFIWCDAPDYKTAETIMEETELRTWANSCRMWNPEVNTNNSGIRNAMTYENMEIFAASIANIDSEE